MSSMLESEARILAGPDDLIKFWRSKVKVTAGLPKVGIWWRRHPRWLD